MACARASSLARSGPHAAWRCRRSGDPGGGDLGGDGLGPRRRRADARSRRRRRGRHAPRSATSIGNARRQPLRVGARGGPARVGRALGERPERLAESAGVAVFDRRVEQRPRRRLVARRQRLAQCETRGVALSLGPREVGVAARQRASACSPLASTTEPDTRCRGLSVARRRTPRRKRGPPARARRIEDHGANQRYEGGRIAERRQGASADEGRPPVGGRRVDAVELGLGAGGVPPEKARASALRTAMSEARSGDEHGKGDERARPRAGDGWELRALDPELGARAVARRRDRGRREADERVDARIAPGIGDRERPFSERCRAPLRRGTPVAASARPSRGAPRRRRSTARVARALRG